VWGLDGYRGHGAQDLVSWNAILPAGLSEVLERETSLVRVIVMKGR